MKRSLVKWVGLTYLFAATHLMTVSCSSSEEGTEEEVAAEEGNNAENTENVENGENNAENPENAENNGNGAEEGNFEGGENFGENNGNNEFGNNNNGNLAANNEFGNQAEGNAAANGENNFAANGENNLAANGAEDGNLQQIIEEMNQTNGQAPAEGQGFDNLAADASGVAAPAADAGAAAAAPAPAPADASAVGMPAAPGLPELGSKMTYVVQKGDTLAKIAQRIYGDMNKWSEIADFTGIANPKLIYPGDVVYYQLTEQSMTFASAYESAPRSEVQVADGDTLATISSRIFGNSSLWKMIWRQNDKIDNPDRLTTGTTLYYLDSKTMASLDREMNATLAQKKAENAAKKISKEFSGKKNNKTVSKKASSKKVIEVANDSVEDHFTKANSQNLMARLI